MKVLSIAAFKDQQVQKIQEASLLKYMSVLTFSDLVSETSQLIKEIQLEPYNQYYLMKSDCLLQEFKARISRTAKKN